jgi:hypothetical protein
VAETAESTPQNTRKLTRTHLQHTRNPHPKPRQTHPNSHLTVCLFSKSYLTVRIAGPRGTRAPRGGGAPKTGQSPGHKRGEGKRHEIRHSRPRGEEAGGNDQTRHGRMCINWTAAMKR